MWIVEEGNWRSMYRLYQTLNHWPALQPHTSSPLTVSLETLKGWAFWGSVSEAHQPVDHIPLCRPVGLASHPLLSYLFLSYLRHLWNKKKSLFLFHRCHISLTYLRLLKAVSLSFLFPCIACFLQVTFFLFGIVSAVEALFRGLIILLGCLLVTEGPNTSGSSTF